jgi:hypothetical protein
MFSRPVLPVLWILAGLLGPGCFARAQSLTWYTNLSDALSLATNTGQYLLLVASRPGCSACDTIVSNYCEMQSPYAIKPLLTSEYVPCHVNIDEDTNWQAYATGLGSFSLPLMAWINPAKPATYLYRTTGLLFSSTFFTALYNRAPFTNAQITRLQYAPGSARLSLARLTYGGSAQIERCTDPAAGDWNPVAAFTCWSKTTNWVDDIGDLPRAFYRVSTVR